MQVLSLITIITTPETRASRNKNRITTALSTRGENYM